MESGIYMIKNEINNKFYIGSTKNFKKRFMIHKSRLKNNNHDNVHLQKSYNKYGDVFSYIILEFVEIEKLLKIEQEYLDKYKNDKNLYNIGLKSSGGDNISNHPNKEKIIKQIKDTIIDRYKNMSKEDKQLISENLKGTKNPNYNNNWSDEMKDKQSKKIKEYYKNNEHKFLNKTFEEIFGEERSKEIKNKLSKNAKERTGEKNPFYNKKHTEESKNKIRQKKIGKYYGKQNIPFFIDNIRYDSLGEASKKLNIHVTTIKYRLKSNNFQNYKYEVND